MWRWSGVLLGVVVVVSGSRCFCGREGMRALCVCSLVVVDVVEARRSGVFVAAASGRDWTGK